LKFILLAASLKIELYGPANIQIYLFEYRLFIKSISDKSPWEEPLTGQKSIKRIGIFIEKINLHA
jgi:hypothetical protein